MDRQTYPPGLLGQLYAVCWQVELLFKNLKSVLQIKNLIATTENGVCIQIYAALILYVLTRVVMLKPALVGQVPVETLSLPESLAAVARGLLDCPALLVKGRTPDWHALEQRLVCWVPAVARRDNPKRSHPITQINAALAAPRGP